MNYGHFDLEKKEYVITKPNTPAPWANYLGSPEYGAIISNNAGGYSFVNPAQTEEFFVTASIQTSLFREDTSICVTMIPAITGLLHGSLLASLLINIRANAVMVQLILLFPPNTAT